MKTLVNSRIEGIFSYAMAMDNRGIKNIIHCIGSSIYIVNFDYSMILHFSLRQNEISFDSPISFNANDYDSPDFSIEKNDDGEEVIIFRTTSKEYERKKICKSDESILDAKTIAKTFHRLQKEAKKSEYLFYLSSECISLLEEDLSHIEISVRASKLKLCQRNVYSGTIIEVIPKSASGFFTIDKLPETLSPIALKTKDFTSLFVTCKSLSFVPTNEFVWVRDSKKDDFEAVVALCKYDAIIDLYNERGKNDGRKE